MQRIAAILLVLCYAALGSGALERWHNQQHAVEDAGVTAAAREAGLPLDHLPLHDESNCRFHAQLHLSGLAVGWTPLLICLGLFVAFLSLLSSRATPQRLVSDIPCRGPPAW